MEGVPVLPEVDHNVEVTRMATIGLIHNDANPIALKKVQTSTYS